MKKNRVILWLIVVALLAGIFVALVTYIFGVLGTEVNSESPTVGTTTVPVGTTEPVTTTVPSETEPQPTESAPTEPSATEPPETEPLVTEPPTTEPPVTESPETEPPVDIIPTEDPNAPETTEPPAEDTNTVNFTDVNETMYTNAHAGLRNGPRNEYKVVDVLDAGVEVLRTGIGDNGFSRVIINGKVYYIRTNCLSKSKPVEEESPSNSVSTDNPYFQRDSVSGTGDKYYAGDGKFYCPYCGKISGDGSSGTCLWYIMGDHNCTCCGEYVPAMTCHTCKEDA